MDDEDLDRAWAFLYTGGRDSTENTDRRFLWRPTEVISRRKFDFKEILTYLQLNEHHGSLENLKSSPKRDHDEEQVCVTRRNQRRTTIKCKGSGRIMVNGEPISKEVTLSDNHIKLQIDGIDYHLVRLMKTPLNGASNMATLLHSAGKDRRASSGSATAASNTRCRLIKEIGHGGFGTVFKGVDAASLEFCAVKMIRTDRPSKTSAPRCEKTLLREMSIHERLKHENIIRFLYTHRTPSCIQLVLEYARGGCLNQRIRLSGGLNEREARHIFKHVVSGLNYLHCQRIAHNDVKPGNILLMSEERLCAAKLADFNLTHDLNETRMRGSLCGTFAFKAPEKVKNMVMGRKEVYTTKVDVWSLGVTLYQTVTNVKPFANCQKIARKLHMEINSCRFMEDVHKLTQFSVEFQSFMSGCLVVQVSQRSSSAELVRHRWFE